MELFLGFLAGALTFINPCVLPVLPIVLGSALQSGRHGPLAIAAGMKQNYDHHLSLKKKDFIIQGLKSFNDFQKKTAVTKKPSINKTDGLSDAERKVLESLSK